MRLGMYFIEILIVAAIYVGCYYNVLSPGSNGWNDTSPMFTNLFLLIVLSYAIGSVFRPITFFYRSSRQGSIVSNVTVLVIIMILLTILFMGLRGHHSFLLPMRFLGMWVAIWSALVAVRYLARYFIRILRSEGHNVHHVVFVGGSDNILELYREMENPFYGYQVEGYFAEVPMTTFPEKFRYLGKVADCVPYMQSHNIQQLYCALPSAMADDIRPIINWCEHHFVRFFSVPNVRNYLKRTMQLELVGDIPVLSIREDPFSSLTNRVVKRFFDLVVSALVMIPFWLIVYPIVAIVTKLTSPGPVFFRQKRNGLNGEEFYCIKFRSMKVNKEADTLQATKDDPRKTRWGDFLRKSSIDELPQFINVLRGEMSVVGPRPHMVKHTREYSELIDKYMVRHWVKPGITGWAQVNGARGETRELWQMEDRIQKDLWYIENWTLWLDLRIIWLTVWHGIVGDKQAY